MLELYINNQPADISESSIITLTKTYENVHNPLLYYADYSKTIQLPISAKNNAIFSNFNRLDSTVTNISIDPTKKIPAFILNNQEPVLEGYIKLNNANTIWTDEKYEVTFYSTLGLIINELKLLTFNKNAVGVDPRYIIDSPLSDDLSIDRNLVKQSFEQQIHYLNSDNVLDWIGFIPTYQGKYNDFSSDKEQLLPSGRTDDMSRERDEHYKREFRSYYQQPFIWVDKLWKVAKDKIESITDYTFNLDGSWFTGSNPYYKDLIYTCPSLFNSDDNFRQSSENFTDKINVVMFNKPSKNPSLSTHNNLHILNLDSANNTGIFNETTGVFNENSTFGSTKVKGRFTATLFASIPGFASDGYWYCKITDDNPFYVRIKAVDLNGNEIYGAKKTFLLYSDDYDVNSNTFDEGIDLGICSISNTGVAGGNRPLINHTGYQLGNHTWQCDLTFELNVAENVPYKLYFEIWNANNGDPFEYTSTFNGITWDWLWNDEFNTSYGQYNDKGYSFYFDSKNLSCETTENLRTGSNVSLYRVFPKDITLCDVLLNYSKMFGLVWDVDEYEKTITVMTRNRFYDDYRILDWTNKIDRSKEFKFVPLTFDKRYVEFNFDEGECGRLKKYQSTYQVNYGNKKLDTGYEFNSETNNLMENLTPSVISQKRQYSCMMNTEYEDKPNFMGYNYMVYPDEHYVDNDDDGNNAGMSGAFYFRNGTFTPDIRLSHWDNSGNYYVLISDDTQHMIQTQEFCWNICGEGLAVCYALPDVSTISKKYNGQRYSVHFESPKEYYFETPDGDVNYIYHSFWENYINERYCSQNKKLTAYVYLSIDEFKDIDFREFIKIDNILYHIDKVYDFNYNSDEPVKMDLVQVWDLSAYTDGQDEVPYLFTVPASVEVTTTDQTVQVYTSYSDYHIGNVPSWITASIDGNGDLTIRANSTTDIYRTGTVILLQGATPTPSDYYQLANGWSLTVKQYPTNPYRLDVDRNTVVFDSLGGTQTVIVDCHNVLNNAISVTTNRAWITANIREYTQTLATRRDCLHLDITVSPRTATISRNGTVTLSITANGTTYTQVINVGQQGGLRHTRDDNYRIITDGDSDLVVLDSNNTQVATLISGETYHFEDLFPEEIDINSIRITGGGSVNITGNSGLQTVEFIPQLSDGDQVGGGLITAATLNGNIVSYAYNVEAQGVTPTPEKRHIIVASDENSMFKIEASPSVMPPKTTNYFEGDFVDGTVITLTALPNDGYTLKRWVDQNDTEYTTPVVTKTVSSSIVDANNIFTIKLETREAQRTYNVEISAGDNGYITIPNDATQYSVFTKTVLEGTTISDVRVTPNAGYTFAQWDDGSILNPRDFTVYSDTTVKAIYTGGSNSRITIDGGGLLGGDDYISLGLNGDDVAKVGIGEVKTITVANDTYDWKLYCHINDVRSAFVNWDIDGVSESTNPYVDAAMEINQDKIIKVVCIENIQYQVRVRADANGIVSVNGVSGDYSQSVLQGTTLTLAATPNTNYQFNGWSDGNNNNPRTITVNNDITLTAAFDVTQYNVSVSAGSNGSVSVNGVSGDYSQSVQSGTTLTLQATPNTNYQFNGWSDGNNNSSRTITVTGNTTLTASFTAIMYNVSVSAGSNGSVSVNGVSGNYSQSVAYGTTLTLQAIPDAGYDFDQWSDGNNSNPRSLTVTGDTTLTAAFESAVVYYNVSVSAGSNGSVSVNGVIGNYSQSVPQGTTLTLQATPDNRYKFSAWSDGNTNSSRNLTVTGNTTLTAAFEADLENTYFYVEDISGETNTLSITKSSSDAYTLTVSYSTDQTNWVSMGSTSTSGITATIPANRKVYLKCNTNSWSSNGGGTNGQNKITCTGKYSIGGNIMSLLNGDNFAGTTFDSNTRQGVFYRLFNTSTTLTYADSLFLPSNTASNCYYGMFGGCTGLIKAPVELPATSTKEYCYNAMFSGCTSLTESPILKATYVGNHSYYGMFINCSNLVKVTTYATNNASSAHCFDYWLQGVSQTGDFYNYGTLTYGNNIQYGGIPSGWTEHTTL